ncbi:MAG: glycosyltransferase family 4 protein [Candidatus Rokubacteria bacterium]|nr:glycosyltransferase family 4 protein [Candidatus Rokubacteria bacterium]
MRPLSVLVVSDVSPRHVGGGAERVLWEQGRTMAAAGHRVRMVSRWTGPGRGEQMEHEGVHVRHFAARPRTPARFLVESILGARRAVAAELAASDADVLQFHQPLSALGVLTSSAGRRLPSLYTFHSAAPLEYRSRRRTTPHHLGGWRGALGMAGLWAIECAVLRRSTRIHVLSRFSAGEVRRLYGIAADRIAIVAGGVDARQFSPAEDRAAVRKALGLPTDRALLLTVRNLEPRMGLDVLLHAIDLVRRDVPGILLLIGGTGPLGGPLQALTRSLGLADHVRFLGFIPDADLPGYYQGADLFVLPTRELEGFGLVTIEALACGTPVVGTAVGATPEILSELDPALLVPRAEPGALARAIVDRLEAERRDVAAAEQLRRRCRRLVELRYTWERTVQELTAELERAVATR